MYIVGASNLDSQRRIDITGLFEHKPEKVTLVIEPENREFVRVLLGPQNFGENRKIERGSRLIIPNWIVKLYPNTNRVLLFTDGNDKHYLKFE